MEYTKKDGKQWAREHLKGIFGASIPTYSGDPLALDEKACRQDLQRLISLGVTGIYLANSFNCTQEEWRRFMQIGVEECAGKVVSLVLVHPDTIAGMFEQTSYAEQIGADVVNLMTPPSFVPSSDEDIYDIHKKVADSVNIGVTLYPAPKAGYVMSPHVIARLAEVTNIVGSKQSPADNVHNLQTFRLAGDKIVIGIPGERDWPLLIEYGLQTTMGTPFAAMFQTLENPWIQEYWDALQARNWPLAMEWYWRLAPLREVFWRVNGFYFSQVGTYPFKIWKYWMGMLGFNHSSIRQPVPGLSQTEKELVRSVLIRVGFIDEATAAAREPDSPVAAELSGVGSK